MPRPRVRRFKFSNDLHIYALAQTEIGARYVRSYKPLRPYLLEFCVRERITPIRLVTMSESLPLISPTVSLLKLIDEVTADAPLQLAYLCHRALGA